MVNLNFLQKLLKAGNKATNSSNQQASTQQIYSNHINNYDFNVPSCVTNTNCTNDNAQSARESSTIPSHLSLDSDSEENFRKIQDVCNSRFSPKSALSSFRKKSGIRINRRNNNNIYIPNTFEIKQEELAKEMEKSMKDQRKSDQRSRKARSKNFRRFRCRTNMEDEENQQMDWLPGQAPIMYNGCGGGGLTQSPLNCKPTIPKNPTPPTQNQARKLGSMEISSSFRMFKLNNKLTNGFYEKMMDKSRKRVFFSTAPFVTSDKFYGDGYQRTENSYAKGDVPSTPELFSLETSIDGKAAGRVPRRQTGRRPHRKERIKGDTDCRNGHLTRTSNSDRPRARRAFDFIKPPPSNIMHLVSQSNGQTKQAVDRFNSNNTNCTSNNSMKTHKRHISQDQEDEGIDVNSSSDNDQTFSRTTSTDPKEENYSYSRYIKPAPQISIHRPNRDRKRLDRSSLGDPPALPEKEIQDIYVNCKQLQHNSGVVSPRCHFPKDPEEISLSSNGKSSGISDNYDDFDDMTFGDEHEENQPDQVKDRPLVDSPTVVPSIPKVPPPSIAESLDLSNDELLHNTELTYFEVTLPSDQDSSNSHRISRSSKNRSSVSSKLSNHSNSSSFGFSSSITSTSRSYNTKSFVSRKTRYVNDEFFTEAIKKCGEYDDTMKKFEIEKFNRWRGAPCEVSA